MPVSCTGDASLLRTEIARIRFRLLLIAIIIDNIEMTCNVRHKIRMAECEIRNQQGLIATGEPWRVWRSSKNIDPILNGDNPISKRG